MSLSDQPTRAQHALAEALKSIVDRVNSDASDIPDVISVPHDDYPQVEMVRFGLQDDGSYGLRVWDENGALIHDLT